MTRRPVFPGCPDRRDRTYDPRHVRWRGPVPVAHFNGDATIDIAVVDHASASVTIVPSSP
jgi:hypothetical protein